MEEMDPNLTTTTITSDDDTAPSSSNVINTILHGGDGDLLASNTNKKGKSMSMVVSPIAKQGDGGSFLLMNNSNRNPNTSNSSDSGAMLFSDEVTDNESYLFRRDPPPPSKTIDTEAEKESKQDINCTETTTVSSGNGDSSDLNCSVLVSPTSDSDCGDENANANSPNSGGFNFSLAKEHQGGHPGVSVIDINANSSSLSSIQSPPLNRSVRFEGVAPTFVEEMQNSSENMGGDHCESKEDGRTALLHKLNRQLETARSDLAKEKVNRRRKEKSMVKLAKELQSRAKDGKDKEERLMVMAETLVSLQQRIQNQSDKLENTEIAYQQGQCTEKDLTHQIADLQKQVEVSEESGTVLRNQRRVITFISISIAILALIAQAGNAINGMCAPVRPGKLVEGEHIWNGSNLAFSAVCGSHRVRTKLVYRGDRLSIYSHNSGRSAGTTNDEIMIGGRGGDDELIFQGRASKGVVVGLDKITLLHGRGGGSQQREVIHAPWAA